MFLDQFSIFMCQRHTREEEFVCFFKYIHVCAMSMLKTNKQENAENEDMNVEQQTVVAGDILFEENKDLTEK